jgi:hypothetical protein
VARGEGSRAALSPVRQGPGLITRHSCLGVVGSNGGIQGRKGGGTWDVAVGSSGWWWWWPQTGLQGELGRGGAGKREAAEGQAAGEAHIGMQEIAGLFSRQGPYRRASLGDIGTCFPYPNLWARPAELVNKNATPCSATHGGTHL